MAGKDCMKSRGMRACTRHFQACRATGVPPVRPQFSSYPGGQRNTRPPKKVEVKVEDGLARP